MHQPNSSQMPLFSKSKAQLGVLGPVERARVGQLQNHDVDRPLSPGARATCLNFQKFDIIVSGLTVTRLLFITLFLTKAAQRHWLHQDIAGDAYGRDSDTG